MTDVIPAAPRARVPVLGEPGATFPVHRIYCVGRNFADHAREMGATPADPAARGRPVFFLKPADAIVVDGCVPYPPATRELHHEVELVVALGRDAPAAKARGLPWDIGKAFDGSAPVSPLVPAASVGDLESHRIQLEVNGERRQQGDLHDVVWSVPEVLHELSRLYRLRAGDRFRASLGSLVAMEGMVVPV